MTPLLNGRGSKSEHHVQCNGKRLVRIRYGFVTDQISICNRSVITIRYTSFDKSTATDPIRYLSIGSVEQSVTDEFLISSGFFFLVVYMYIFLTQSTRVSRNVYEGTKVVYRLRQSLAEPLSVHTNNLR